MTLDDFLNGSWTIRDLRAGPFRDCLDLYTARLRKDGYPFSTRCCQRLLSDQRSAFCRSPSSHSRDTVSTVSRNMVTAELIACRSSLPMSYAAE